jgi:hypothetical protein
VDVDVRARRDDVCSGHRQGFVGPRHDVRRFNLSDCSVPASRGHNVRLRDKVRRMNVGQIDARRLLVRGTQVGRTHISRARHWSRFEAARSAD